MHENANRIGETMRGLDSVDALDGVPSTYLPTSLHERIVALLRDMIVTGQLLPGERVAEPLLCKKLGVSRTPLREALKVLASEKLVDLLPNRGAVISGVGIRETGELFEIMGGLELAIGERAAIRMSDRDLEELEQLHEAIRQARAMQHRERFSATNRIFHDRLCDLAGNSTLAAIYRHCQLRITRVRHLANLSGVSWDESLEEHEAIMVALRLRDGPMLGRELRRHRMNTSQRFMTLVRESRFFQREIGFDGEQAQARPA